MQQLFKSEIFIIAERYSSSCLNNWEYPEKITKSGNAFRTRISSYIIWNVKVWSARAICFIPVPSLTTPIQEITFLITCTRHVPLFAFAGFHSLLLYVCVAIFLHLLWCCDFLRYIISASTKTGQNRYLNILHLIFLKTFNQISYLCIKTWFGAVSEKVIICL